MLINFSSELLVFVSERAKVRFAGFFERIAQSLFFKEWSEWIAHCRSFVMSELSKSLTDALLFRATWAICSRSLFKKSNWAKSNESDSLFNLSNLSERSKSEFSTLLLSIQYHHFQSNPNWWGYPSIQLRFIFCSGGVVLAGGVRYVPDVLVPAGPAGDSGTDWQEDLLQHQATIGS